MLFKVIKTYILYTFRDELPHSQRLSLFCYYGRNEPLHLLLCKVLKNVLAL